MVPKEFIKNIKKWKHLLPLKEKKPCCLQHWKRKQTLRICHLKSFPTSSNIFQLLSCSKNVAQVSKFFYRGTKTPRSHLHISMTIRSNLKKAKALLEQATLMESLFIKIKAKKLSFEWREHKEWKTNKTPIGSSIGIPCQTSTTTTYQDYFIGSGN